MSAVCATENTPVFRQMVEAAAHVPACLPAAPMLLSHYKQLCHSWLVSDLQRSGLNPAGALRSSISLISLLALFLYTKSPFCIYWPLGVYLKVGAVRGGRGSRTAEVLDGFQGRILGRVSGDEVLRKLKDCSINFALDLMQWHLFFSTLASPTS